MNKTPELFNNVIKISIDWPMSMPDSGSMADSITTRF
jgi:hypothetical protein